MRADGGVGRGKATFDDRYDRPDPRGLFGDLAALDYEIPQHAHGVFATLLSALRGDRGEPVTVLDVCCSYGVNAALMRCDLTLVDLFRRYADATLADATSEELIGADRAFYAQHLRPDAPRVLGLDTAANAIAYGRAVGLLDAGIVENLETHDPSEHLARAVAGVDLVTTTGGVGYVTERTFDALTGAFPPAGDPPWVATFVLRMFGYDRIASVLERRGLVTEQLAATSFRQRRFASASEQDAAVADVRARGLDTSGKEDDGWYHADLFLSRPAADVSRQSLPDLLAGGSAAPHGAARA